jgi:hypothetical protein
MAPGSYALEEVGGMQTPAIDKENEDNYQTKCFLLFIISSINKYIA